MKNNIDTLYFQNKNIKYLAGTDEVGRGSLAGPIVVAAVILPSNYFNNEITDSKILSKKKRENLSKEIINIALAYSIIEMSVIDVEKYNPKKASIIGMEKCIEELKIKPNFILTDAEKINFKYNYDPIKFGDKKSQSIAAASIIAKVYRDRLMNKYDNNYPGYNFKMNKGYGTKEHLRALNNLGITPIHRKTYKPIKNILSFTND